MSNQRPDDNQGGRRPPPPPYEDILDRFIRDMGWQTLQQMIARAERGLDPFHTQVGEGPAPQPGPAHVPAHPVAQAAQPVPHTASLLIQPLAMPPGLGRGQGPEPFRVPVYRPGPPGMAGQFDDPESSDGEVEPVVVEPARTGYGRGQPPMPQSPPRSLGRGQHPMSPSPPRSLGRGQPPTPSP